MIVGGSAYFATRESPECIFTRLVAILQKARVRDIAEPSPSPWRESPTTVYPINRDYNAPYSITITYGNTTQYLGFTPDAWGTRKLSAGESVVAEVFTSLVASLLPAMAMTQVD